MATVAPAQLVAGPARAPLAFGLFSVLGWRTGGERWENGVIFESEPCAPIDGIGAYQCDPAETVGLPKTLEVYDGATSEASPFTLYGTYVCSPIGNSFDHAQERANARLFAREEMGAESALWTGSLGNVPNLSGANGFAAPTNLGTFGLWAGVAKLEQSLAATYGAVGTLHMSREVATRLHKEGELEVRGGRMFTPLGTPIVAGAGYTSDRVVATGALLGYRGDVFTSSNRPGDLLDRSQNDLHAIAERLYLLGFDDCALFEFTIETTP